MSAVFLLLVFHHQRFFLAYLTLTLSSWARSRGGQSRKGGGSVGGKEGEVR